MKRVLVFILLAATVAFAAVENGQVLYLGGTLPGVKEGAVGRLDSTGESALVFEHPENDPSARLLVALPGPQSPFDP